MQYSVEEPLPSLAMQLDDQCVAEQDALVPALTIGHRAVRCSIPALGGYQVQVLTKDHTCRAFRTWEKAGLATGSRRHVYTVLRQVLAVAVEQCLILETPLHGIKAPDASSTLFDVWTEDQLDLFLDATRDVIRLHDLRHTHAAIRLPCDGNVRAIATRLGHDSTMLMKIYPHYMLEDQERAVERFETALARARKERLDSAQTGT